MRISKKTYKKYLDRLEQEEAIKNYTDERKMSYLFLYGKLRIMILWEKIPKNSISITKLNRILDEFLTPFEKKCVIYACGLDTGIPKSFEELEEEFQLSKLVIRSTTIEVFEKVQALACMDYISHDLMEIKRSPISKEWQGSIFDFSTHTARILVKAYIDLDKLAIMNEFRLRKFNGVGDATIKEIRNYFKQKGLEW